MIKKTLINVCIIASCEFSWCLIVRCGVVWLNSCNPFTGSISIQWGYDFFHKRTLGAALTWGRAFPHMYFVWGTVPWQGQPNDEQHWLQSANCTRLRSSSAVAASPTTSSSSSRSNANRPWARHQCCDRPVNASLSNDLISAKANSATAACVTVLEATQCNALYYGNTGPCCR